MPGFLFFLDFPLLCDSRNQLLQSLKQLVEARKVGQIIVELSQTQISLSGENFLKVATKLPAYARVSFLPFGDVIYDMTI